MPEKPRRTDLAAGELEFTDDKVRVVLMFLLLDNFVEWGNGGGGVKERAVVILTYSRMHATRVSAWHASWFHPTPGKGRSKGPEVRKCPRSLAGIWLQAS